MKTQDLDDGIITFGVTTGGTGVIMGSAGDSVGTADISVGSAVVTPCVTGCIGDILIGDWLLEHS